MWSSFVNRHTRPLTAYQSWIGLHKLAPKLQANLNLDSAVHISEQIVIYETTSVVTAATTKRVAKELDPLFSLVENFLEAKGLSLSGQNPDKVPLFLMATGGMRRLKQQDYDSYNILKNATIGYINKSVFTDPHFDTIDGDDEGLYGWVAANIVDRRFQNGLLPHGFMEMGGESAQIAVSLTQAQYLGYGGLLRGLELGGRRYVVFSKTWPGLGVESAWRRHEERLRESGSTLAYDPCLPNQFAYRLSGSDKIVTGTGDFPECLKETITLLGCPHKACANGQLCIYRGNTLTDRVGCLLRDPLTGNTFMRFDENQFRGASVYARAMYGIFEELDPLVANGDGDPFGVFWTRVNALADRNWDQLKADRPRDLKYLQKSFFMAGMIMSTLFFGFGIAMPAQAAAVGNNLALERARRALREALAVARDAEEKARVAIEELERQRELGLLQVDEANAALDPLQQLLNNLPNPNVAQFFAANNDFTGATTAAQMVNMAIFRSHAAAQQLFLRQNNLREANKALQDATARRDNAIAEVHAKTEQIDAPNRQLQMKRQAVNNARHMPAPNPHPPLDQQNLYQASAVGADWTLGFVVLHASKTKPIILSEHTWSGLAQFLPHHQ